MDVGRDSKPPETVTFRRFPDGFEIALLPPPRLKTSRKIFLGNLAGAAFLLACGTVAVVAGQFFKAFEEGCFLVFSLFFGGMFALTALLVVLDQFQWNRSIAVLEARDGLLTLVQSGGVPPKQWRLADIHSVRVWPSDSDDGRWDLQLDLKDRSRRSILEGRRNYELSWMAGLLRAAIAPPRRPASVAEAPVVYLKGGVCQVCGSAMEERVVACARCRTPHHEECWIYNGTCSTYGCREIRYTRSA